MNSRAIPLWLAARPYTVAEQRMRALVWAWAARGSRVLIRAHGDAILAMVRP